MIDKRVAIIGGGITGLAAAWELQKQGVPYTLFEASDRLGGKVVTEHIDGFTIEGGPDSFLASKPWAWQLCDELGLRDRMIGTNDAQRNVFILKNGKLHPFPKGMRLIVPVDEAGLLASDLLSDEGKRRMLAEVDLQPYDAPADESLASFMRRHFGQEALDVFVEPLLAGIYVGDPEQMSVRATYPQYIEMERIHGSLIHAMRSAPPTVPDPRAPKTAFFSLKGGTQELIDTLASKLTGEIRLKTDIRFDLDAASHPLYEAKALVLVIQGQAPDTIPTTKLRRVTYRSTVYEIYVQEYGLYSTVIATVSARQMYEVLSTMSKPIKARSEWLNIFNDLAFSESSSNVVNLGYRTEDVPFDLNGFGFVVPSGEPTLVKACTWSSTKLAGRAPANHVLIRVFLKSQTTGQVANAQARIELEKLMGIPRDLIPVVRRSFYWPNQQYVVGHLEQVAELERLSPPGVFLAGSSYRGVGVPDCIHQGQIAAQKAIAHLKSKRKL